MNEVFGAQRLSASQKIAQRGSILKETHTFAIGVAGITSFFEFSAACTDAEINDFSFSLYLTDG